MKLDITLLIVFFYISVANSAEIQVVTENYPPYQIVKNENVVGGLAVDIVNKLLSRTKTKSTIDFYPWARAYQIALTEKNVLIFSITRTKERESKFKWVGSIVGVQDYLWSLKSNKNIEVTSLEEAKKYIIAVPKNDNQHYFFDKNGFYNIYITTNFDSALKMLYAKHVDLIMGPEISTYYRLKELNLDYLKLEKEYKIDKKWGELSIAFSSDTDDEIVGKFKKALKEIKDDGTFKKIIIKWLPNYYD